jgi:hypothetical protein
MCNEMKSVYAVPTPLRFGTTLFDYVGSIDLKNAFRYASSGTSDIMVAAKYAGRRTFYDYVNDYIVIKNNNINYNESPIPMIAISGVFDKPIEVMQFNCKNGKDCDYWDKPYPATGDMIQMIIQYIKQVDYGQQVDKDKSNPPEVEVNPTTPRNT